ncbi:MAG: nicotinamide-nucleotide adenylyltransferase [Candidatus Njordarchaeia archaeon]|nr:nicotinamide-nucleotide adenylyltransferase [Candidatus Korarchaeota archaeon]
MTRGLFIGRFQPLHKGHTWAINRILEQEDEIILCIGSAQENYTLENPLTAGERIELIITYLKEANLYNRAIIIPIPDIFENFIWPRRVLEFVPKFSRVYSGNELVLALFELINIRTVRLEHIDREKYQGRVIRQKILNNEEWKDLVPSCIYKKLKELKFEERIRRLSKHYVRKI